MMVGDCRLAGWWAAAGVISPVESKYDRPGHNCRAARGEPQGISLMPAASADHSYFSASSDAFTISLSN